VFLGIEGGSELQQTALEGMVSMQLVVEVLWATAAAGCK
jgi:hypothetical protein